jgi:hypothetical protein
VAHHSHSLVTYFPGFEESLHLPNNPNEPYRLEREPLTEMAEMVESNWLHSFLAELFFFFSFWQAHMLFETLEIGQYVNDKLICRSLQTEKNGADEADTFPSLHVFM